MVNTYYDMAAKIIPGRVTGYDKAAHGIENASYTNMAWPHSAGSLASSVDDLAKWDAALYTDKLVKQTTLKRAWIPYKLKDGTDKHYGYGWGICPYQGHTLSGYIKIQANSLSHAQELVIGNPVFEAGGTVEIRELPKD